VLVDGPTRRGLDRGQCGEQLPARLGSAGVESFDLAQSPVFEAEAGPRSPASGQAVRAREMARDGLYRARLNAAASNPVPPQAVKINRSGSAVHISWSAPPCRVTAYNVEISTDSGATWSAVSLADGPIATYCDTTAPPTAPVWVRSSTTNPVGTSDTTLPEKA
jgi:hypothetical protein